ncbi:hypothetical protein PIB30_096967, partial [Stylosanthes scabra]|nr:hypothetical protein [Stylosanthes scabra]
MIVPPSLSAIIFEATITITFGLLFAAVHGRSHHAPCRRGEGENEREVVFATIKCSLLLLLGCKTVEYARKREQGASPELHLCQFVATAPLATGNNAVVTKSTADKSVLIPSLVSLGFGYAVLILWWFQSLPLQFPAITVWAAPPDGAVVKVWIVAEGGLEP